MKNFNEERIEIILIIAGAFLGTYLFMMALMAILNGLYTIMN
jgi:hypothetical protein